MANIQADANNLIADPEAQQDCYGISKFLKCALHFMQCWCAAFAGVAKTSLPGDCEATQHV